MDLKDALFQAIERYVLEKHEGHHCAAGTRLGVPRYRMSRWFSDKCNTYTGFNPPVYILETLVHANVDLISSIALALLQDEQAVPDFDYI